MRLFNIDFTLENMLPDGNCLGRRGEHNATTLVIVPPSDMTESNKVTAFKVVFGCGCTYTRSELIAKSSKIQLPISAQVSKAKEISIQLEGYGEEGELIVKSEVITGLIFLDSIGGACVDYDTSGGTASEVIANTKARHSHSNIATLNKLTTSENGVLLFNGEEIKGEGVSEEQAQAIEDNTFARHSHDNKDVIDKFTYNTAKTRPAYNGMVLATQDDASLRVAEHRSEVIETLANYVKKDDISDFINLRFEVVEALPDTGESNVIYLLPNSSEGSNIYDEYIYVNEAFEIIGSTAIDLSNYYTIKETDETFAKKTDIPESDFDNFVEEISESVNLYQPQPVEAFLDNHSLASSGAIQEATKRNYFLSPQIPVEPNTTYTITGQQWETVETGLASRAKGRAYTVSGEIIGDSTSYIEFVQNEDESWTFTTPENASYILLACYKDPFGQGNTASIDLIVPVFNSSFMLVKGTELPSEYEPFGEVSYRLKDIDIPLNSVNLENIGDEGLPIFAPLAGKTIVNFGDSIFGNAQAPTDISSFLAEKTGATVYNCGFGGCRMTNTHPTAEYDAFAMVNLADAIVSGDFTLQNNAVNSTEVTLNNSIKANFETLKTVDFSNVDIITIAYGSNDFKGIAFENEENALDKSKFAGALRYSIETLLATYPHLRIYVLSVAWRFYIDENNEYTDDSNTYTNGLGLTVKDYNAKLAEVAEEYNLPFVDDYNIGIGKFNRSYYFGTTDPAHHLETGRRLIASNLAKELY